MANYDANHAYGGVDKGLFRRRTTPVGSLPNANAWGLFDMHGNVWEWCSSRYKPYPYQADDGREDLSGGERRVLRGGSWDDLPLGARSAYRFRYSPVYRNYLIGFRVAMDPL